MKLVRDIRDRTARFMTGRNGSDALNRGLLILWALFLILGLITRSVWLYIPQFIICVVVFFRMLSRNTARRQRENQAYYGLMKKIGGAWRRLTVRIRDRKVANFFRCPKCRADIRMPKRSGRFKIRCPKCGEEFTKSFK